MEKSIRKIMFILMIVIIAISLRFGFEYVYNFILNLIDHRPYIGFAIRTLLVAIVVVVWMYVSLRSENPTQKLPWLLILTFEPIIGITLFLSFGRGFKNSFRYRRRPLIHDDAYITKETKSSDGPLTLPTDDKDLTHIFHASHRISYHQPFADSTEITVLKNGEAFYPDLINSIENAKQFILMEFFIIRNDTRSRQVLDLMMKKAEEGIEVKLIFDALGSARISRKYLKKLRKSPIDVIINDRIYFPLFNTRMNFRNHRKIVVVDGLVGYTGGMNLADEYDNTIAYDYYFRDTQVKLVGEAVRSLTCIFFKDYYYNTGHFIDDDIYYPKTNVKTRGITQILQSGPDSHEAHIRNVYLKMILTAKKSIRIMTPYMALDQETLTALIVARRSGVDVEIIIPGTPDKRLVYNVTKFFATVMLKHDINVYQYTKGFSHAKIFVIDDKLASVGSYNLDNRSAVIDFEITALFTGSAVQTIVDQFIQDKQDSHKIDPITWQKRNIFIKVFEGLLSIFAPII